MKGATFAFLRVHPRHQRQLTNENFASLRNKYGSFGTNHLKISEEDRNYAAFDRVVHFHNPFNSSHGKFVMLVAIDWQLGHFHHYFRPELRYFQVSILLSLIQIHLPVSPNTYYLLAGSRNSDLVQTLVAG